MKCNWCGSPDDCYKGCECAKCIDPTGYDNWKFNPDKTFSDSYKNWLKKERKKFELIKEIPTMQNDQIFESKLHQGYNLGPEILCPICGFEYNHPVICWVVGPSTFRCDSYDVMDESPEIEKLLPKGTGRGSTIIILYHCENGDFWLSISAFHEGITYFRYEKASSELIKELGLKNKWREMWRD